MKPQTLSILGLGLELPPAVNVSEYAASKGADASFYKGWERACHVRGDEDQPSTLGAQALRHALARSGVPAQALRAVVFTGVSRDYLPSWSVATEVMRLVGIEGDDCVGLDLALGCAATLSALDLLQGWLALRGGGCAAIVAAERWSHTVDHSDARLAGMWAWADGGAALVVGMGTPGAAVADFLGAEFSSHSEYNGHVLVPYGGTRAPVAPPGVSPHARQVSSHRSREEIRATYVRGYKRAYEAVVRRVGTRGERLICNQISLGTIEAIAEQFGIPMEHVVLTGHDSGHLGACDVIVALDKLAQRKQIDAPIAVGSSTAYAYGTGLLAPPGYT